MVLMASISLKFQLLHRHLTKMVLWKHRQHSLEAQMSTSSKSRWLWPRHGLVDPGRELWAFEWLNGLSSHQIDSLDCWGGTENRQAWWKKFAAFSTLQSSHMLKSRSWELRNSATSQSFGARLEAFGIARSFQSRLHLSRSHLGFRAQPSFAYHQSFLGSQKAHSDPISLSVAQHGQLCCFRIS